MKTVILETLKQNSLIKTYNSMKKLKQPDYTMNKKKLFNKKNYKFLEIIVVKVNNLEK